MTEEYTKNTNKNQDLKKLNKISQDKLTPGQFERMLDYIKRRKNGEKLPDFVLNHPMNKDEAKNWEFKFWQNRPVPKLDETISLVSIIDNDLKNKFKNQDAMYEPYECAEFVLTNFI